ncbi:phosphonate metabolism transcriptional regulator PhnF [Oricola cellulosilytica]|uniref:phosphonate metabolism transcriptional regulator PhnF n=1 Tax=Oricola cellulosilytica TaxID=1429082 RepID=UPI003D1745AC
MLAGALLERKSGVALWRQIADLIRSEIETGAAAKNGKLPPEMKLAERYGVNRHTVRAAIAALEQEGALRSEQGRGTFVCMPRRLSYPIGKRTRFSAGLEGQAETFRTRLVKTGTAKANPQVTRALALPEGTECVSLETVSETDGMPISRAISWFDAARFGNIAEVFAEKQSITMALATDGIPDYVRRWTTIEAHHASPDDIALLKLSSGAIVLVTHSVNEDLDNRAIQYSETRFAADRVELYTKLQDS